jgi:hypothetical protein
MLGLFFGCSSHFPRTDLVKVYHNSGDAGNLTAFCPTKETERSEIMNAIRQNYATVSPTQPNSNGHLGDDEPETIELSLERRQKTVTLTLKWKLRQPIEAGQDTQRLWASWRLQ